MAGAGIIGLGQIGAGVAVCLARVDLLTAIYDVRPDAVGGLANMPPMSPSPAAVARACDVVLIAVNDAAQTLQALSGPDGVLAAARPDLTIVLLATISLDDLAHIRDLAAGAGVGLIDCGVTRGEPIERNSLVCMVGAADDQLARAMPILQGFAKAVYHMGGPGAGMAAKLARNVVAYGCLRAGYEGAALARAAGIDLDKFVGAIENSGGESRGPMLFVRKSVNPADAAAVAERHRIRALADKDLEAALDLAATLHLALPLTKLTRDTNSSTLGLEQDGAP